MSHDRASASVDPSTGDAIEIRVRPMAVRDLDRVVAIEGLGSPNPWARDAFEHELGSNPLSRAIVATSGRREKGRGPESVVGFCVFWVVFEELAIHNVGVHPEHRRRGIGRLLLSRAISEGLGHGASRAHLEVRRSNAAARRLYAELGFELAGERREYYSRPREDAVLYEKLLQPPDAAV